MNDQGIITSKRIIRLFTLALLLLSFMIIPGPSAQAKKKYKGWVQKTNGRIYYYEASGRKARSKRKLLGRKLYYFDANGRQHVGWIKIKDHYCYYNLERGKNGFLVKNKTVNGIKIDGNGYAVDNLDKVRLLAEANRIAFNLTNFNMTLREKNKACFLYIKDNTNWRNLKGFRTENKDWDMFYAEYALFKNTGDCYSGGCAFAYMAAAVGNENVYAESSGGHGWCTINDRFYDPNWSWAQKNFDDYFDVPESLSGKSGRPSWAKHRLYKKRID